LDENVVRQISAYKEEPEWMLEFRLNAYRHYRKRPIPTWGADLSGLNLNEIIYYARPKQIDQKSWDDVPEISKIPLTALAYLKRNRSTWQASGHSTTRKWSTTISRKTWKNRA
jgi:Fe-S cluster assembly protein SufB